MDKTKIIYKPVDELIPYINNPRKNDQAVDAVASSINNFGFKVPIVIDKYGEIVTGHTRLKAAKKLGLKEVPVIIADDLTENQVRAFRLADNKVAELAEWDEEILQAELDLTDFDMEQFGFEEMQEIVSDEAFDDDFEEDLPDEPETQPGDIYKMGDHILMCGDSTKSEDVQTLMGGQMADLVVTDPPYNVNYEGGTKDALKIQNDNMDDASFLAFLIDAFKTMKEALKPGGAFYIWHSDGKRWFFSDALKQNDLEERQNLIWVKNALVLGRQDYQWKHEPCLYGWKEGAAHRFIDLRGEETVIEDNPSLNKMSKSDLIQYVKELRKIIDDKTTILREDKPLTNDLHPTMKPVPLIAYLIKNSSRKNEVVLDLFGGSGTTLIACEQLGRKARIMELDPKYCDVIVSRWEELTGREAEKITR
ncbi:DNA modification methylase [Facklamia hominis]|uniref:DNA modification methylase n=1 Tax=Facklamia hominis TaxID=178214 RepID=UPI0038FCC2D0